MIGFNGSFHTFGSCDVLQIPPGAGAEPLLRKRTDGSKRDNGFSKPTMGSTAVHETSRKGSLAGPMCQDIVLIVSCYVLLCVSSNTLRLRLQAVKHNRWTHPKEGLNPGQNTTPQKMTNQGSRQARSTHPTVPSPITHYSPVLRLPLLSPPVHRFQPARSRFCVEPGKNRGLGRLPHQTQKRTHHGTQPENNCKSPAILKEKPFPNYTSLPLYPSARSCLCK